MPFKRHHYPSSNPLDADYCLCVHCHCQCYRIPKRPSFGRGTPPFALGDRAKTRLAVGASMVAETCKVAFTNRQWEAYQFVLKFHRLRQRAPTAVELSQGLGITLR